MKYVKIALTMALLVAFVFATADAAKSSKANSAGTLPMPKALVGKITPQQWQQMRQEMAQEQQKHDADQPVTPSPAVVRVAKGATLSGDINVGALAGAGYTSIRAAIATLIANGGVGAGGVRFLLTDPVYAESAAVLVTGIAGTSASNPLTFQPAAGNTSCLVKGPFDATNNGFFVIKTQSHVTIEGVPAGGTPGVTAQALTIRLAEPVTATNRFTGSVRVIQSQSVTIQDCIILGGFDATKAKSFDAISTSSGSTRALCLDNFAVKYNIVTHGRYGIDMSSSSPFPSDSNVVIQHNHFGGAFAGAAGLSAGDYTDSLTNNAIITGDIMYSDIGFNIVDGIRLPAALTLEGTTNTRRMAGIYATFANHTAIHSNVVKNVYYARTSSTLSSGGRIYGIQLGGNSALVGNSPGVNAIYNNAVSHIHSDMIFAAGTFYGTAGIFAGFDNHVKIWHNSVWLSDASAQNSYWFGLLAYGTTQNGANVYYENNAVKMTMPPGPNFLGEFCFGTADISNTNGPSYQDENHNDFFYDANGALSSDGSPLATWNLLTGFGAQSVFGEPNFTSTTDLHIAAGPSYTYHIGMVLPGPYGPITTDADGSPRNAPAPTAGAYENGVTGVVDVATLSVAGGYMHGTAIGAAVDLNVLLKNNGYQNASTTLHATVSDGYSKSVVVNVPAMSFLAYAFTGANQWAPASTGVNTITAAATVASDIDVPNDTAVNAEFVFPVLSGVKYSTSFETNADVAGWLGLGDWELGTPTKLSGPHTGSKAWATKLSPDTTYSGGNHVVSMLFSPYFDFTSNLHPNVSFFQDMQTEPSWDASVLQYTSDLGATWHVVGQLADLKGQNWYGGVYLNAAGDLNCFANYQNPPDDGTVFPDPDNPANPYPKWTSNGDCAGADVPTGPAGYVPVQLIADQVGGKPLVQFRYLANPDASGDDLGWLFDDFAIHPSTVVSGFVWNDANNDTFKQAGEPGLSGATVTATPSDTTMHAISGSSDGTGAYGLSLLNGNYTLTATGPTGTATAGAGGYNFNVIANPPIAYNFNFGYYNPATISGTVYNDINHNHARDLGEPGIAGVPVSFMGSVIANTTTGGTGQYTLSLPLLGPDPGAPVNQTAPAGFIEFTAPAPTPAINPGDVLTGYDFGDVANAVGQSYRTFSYEDWALAKDAAGKYKSIKCKPNQVQFKFQLTVPQDANGTTLYIAWKNAYGRITKGTLKQDSIGNIPLGAGGTVTFSPALVPGDVIQIDGYQVPGSKRVAIKYGWAPTFTKAKLPVEVFLMNNPRLPRPNLHNVGEEIFGQLLQPVLLDLGKIKMTAYKSVQNGMNNGGTIHTSGIGCAALAKVTDALKPSKVQNKLYAELLTLKMNILASDLGKTPPGFGDLIYDDQQNPTDPFNGKSIRTVLAQCDTFFSCLDTPKGSDGNVYYSVLRRLNHDSFRDSTNVDTLTWSCQKITLTGATTLANVPWLQANPNPVTVPVPTKALTLYNRPNAFALKQNYPNPFNPSTTINFALPFDGSLVTLKVYNVLGQEVATLIDNATMDAGTYPVEFSASNLASGIYFYRLNVHATNDDGASTSFSQVKKMLLMK